MIATVPIFVLVVTVILFSAWRLRMRPGEEHKDGPPIHGNTQLEVIWTAFPAALCSARLYSFVVLHENGKQPAGDRDRRHRPAVRVDLRYPASVTGGAPMKTTQLYLPDNEPVDFKIHSVDVIHAFWIPAFRLQEDAVPGITTSFRATPDRLGSYPISATCSAASDTRRCAPRPRRDPRPSASG